MNTSRTIVDLRHDLHRHPEVGLDLPWTQRYLVEILEKAGIEIVLGRRMTSVAAIVRGSAVPPGGRSVPTVLVRSDMDALPIAEATGLDWAAQNGAMHACGHDCHMAIVVSAALETHRRRAELTGDAVFFFQPGEEGHGGAQLALDEGLLSVSGSRPIAALGLHVLAHLLQRGEFASRDGAVLSGSTLVDVDFEGRGGHGSSPHLARSPLTAAADLIGGVGAAIANGVSMFDPVVMTFGSLHAGDARNVIPDRATASGVIRSFSDEADAQVQKILRRVAEGTAEAHGVRAEVRARRDTVPTVTATAELEAMERTASARGRAITRLASPIGISEDFSWIMREVPGVFLLVGARTGDDAVPESNHSSRATFSDDVLAETAELVAHWVFDRLADASREASRLSG